MTGLRAQRRSSSIVRSSRLRTVCAGSASIGFGVFARCVHGLIRRKSSGNDRRCSSTRRRWPGRRSPPLPATIPPRPAVAAAGRRHRVFGVVAAPLLRQQPFAVAEHAAILAIGERAALPYQRQGLLRFPGQRIEGHLTARRRCRATAAACSSRAQALALEGQGDDQQQSAQQAQAPVHRLRGVGCNGMRQDRGGRQGVGPIRLTVGAAASESGERDHADDAAHGGPGGEDEYLRCSANPGTRARRASGRRRLRRLAFGRGTGGEKAHYGVRRRLPGGASHISRQEPAEQVSAHNDYGQSRRRVCRPASDALTSLHGLTRCEPFPTLGLPPGPSEQTRSGAGPLSAPPMPGAHD